MKMYLKIFLCVALVASGFLFFPASSLSQGVKAWTNLGLYGGQIYDIAIDPSNPNKMFAGSHMGDGLFVTSDDGSYWQAVEATNDPPGEGTFKNHANRAVKIAPSDPQIIWVAHNYWVEKSTDGGQTWTHISHDDMQIDCSGCTENEYNRFCQAIAIHPTNPDIVYVGTGGPFSTSTSGAIYKTEDGGETWTKLGGIFDWSWNPIPGFNYPIISIEIDANSDNIWAATGGPDVLGGSLYFSNDQGQTWWDYANLPDTIWLDMALQPHATGQPSQVFIATDIGLLRITFDSDDWATWLDHSWILGGTFGTENGIRSVVFDPQNPEIVYAAWYTLIEYGGDGIGKVGRSTDGGDNWSVYEPDLYFLSLSVHPTNPEVVFGGHINLGVYKSQDHGQTWTPANDGLNAVIVKDVAVDPNNSNHILIGTVSGVYEKTGSGAFSRIFEDESGSVLFHPVDSLTFFAGTEGYVNKTTDGGLNWTSANIQDHGSINRISDIAIDPSNTDVMFVAVDYYSQGGSIYKSDDGGDSFTKVLEGVNQDDNPVAMYTVAIDPLNPQHIFAGGGLFYAPGNVGDLWESTDGGSNWTRTSLQNVIVNDLLIDPNDSNIMYAGCGHSGGTYTPIYKSTDGGVTWAPSFYGIPILPIPLYNSVTDLEFHRQNKSVVYASTVLQGVYISPNRGGNWLNLGTPEYAVFAISTSSLYAATQGGLLQCTGTGVLAGNIKDAATGNDIDNAIILSDLGPASVSIDGDYMMISPAGITKITFIANGLSNKIVEDIEVYGSDVRWVNIEMDSGVSNTDLDTNLNDSSGSKGGPYCFITSIENGLALHNQIGIGAAFIILGALCLRLVFVRKKKKQQAGKLTGTLFVCIFTLSVIIFFLLYSSDLHAAGTLWGQVGIASSPNPVGSGARALGMGGAFIAIADDATAASWNPSGLIQLEKPELSMVVDYNSRSEGFSSNDRPEIDNTGKADEYDLNYISAAYPFKFYRNMVVAINYQRLYNFNRDFDYTLDYASAGLDLHQDKSYEQEGSVGAAGLAAAVQVTPKISVGVTVNIWTEQLFWDNGWEEKFNEQSTGSLSGVPVTYDTDIEDKYSHFRGINANLGVLWDINNKFTLGAVFKSPFTASLYHEFDYSQTQTFGPPIDSTITSEYSFSEDAELHMPMSYGLGFAWRFSDEFTVDFDIYRTHWSDYIFEDEEGNKFSPIDGRPKSDSNVQDTTQIRLGGEYLIIREDKGMVIPVRAGLFYDPEPSEGSPEDFYGFTAGSGIAYKRLIFDLAYQYRWGKDVDTGNLIATSKADITQHTFLISLIFHF